MNKTHVCFSIVILFFFHPVSSTFQHQFNVLNTCVFLSFWLHPVVQTINVPPFWCTNVSDLISLNLVSFQHLFFTVYTSDFPCSIRLWNLWIVSISLRHFFPLVYMKLLLYSLAKVQQYSRWLRDSSNSLQKLLSRDSTSFILNRILLV